MPRPRNYLDTGEDDLDAQLAAARGQDITDAHVALARMRILQDIRADDRAKDSQSGSHSSYRDRVDDGPAGEVRTETRRRSRSPSNVRRGHVAFHPGNNIQGHREQVVANRDRNLRRNQSPDVNRIGNFEQVPDQPKQQHGRMRQEYVVYGEGGNIIYRGPRKPVVERISYPDHRFQQNNVERSVLGVAPSESFQGGGNQYKCHICQGFHSINYYGKMKRCPYRCPCNVQREVDGKCADHKKKNCTLPCLQERCFEAIAEGYPVHKAIHCRFQCVICGQEDECKDSPAHSGYECKTYHCPCGQNGHWYMDCKTKCKAPGCNEIHCLNHNVASGEGIHQASQNI